MTQPAAPAANQDWFSQNAPPAATPAAANDWFAQNARPATMDTPELSFLQRAATQPSKYGYANPLHYFDELGKGMAQGLEAIGHPVDTAEKTYKFLTENPNESWARDMEEAKKPLPEMAKDAADTLMESYGQAATFGAAGKVVEGTSGALSDAAKIASEKAMNAARKVTPKQAATAAGTSGATALAHQSGLGGWSLAAGSFGGKTLGYLAETLLGKERANTPIFQKAASLDDAANTLAEVIAKDRAAQGQAEALSKLPATGAKPAGQTGEALATAPQTSNAMVQPKPRNAAPRFTAEDRAAAQSLLEDALKQHSEDVIEKAIPGNTEQAAQTKGAVDYYLRKGDVAGAERALDKGAKTANPKWTPLDRQPVPSVDEIRERVQAEAKPPAPSNREDQLDTHALQQEMNWNLERHGWSAESEARREFIARNSNAFSKSGKSRGYVEGEPVKLTKTPSVKASGTGTPAVDLNNPETLMDQIQKSLDEVRRKQQGK